MTNSPSHHNLQDWAATRATSLEIAEVIFDMVNNDELLAQQLWQEGNDEVVRRAFAKTDKETLFWGEQTLHRACGEE